MVFSKSALLVAAGLVVSASAQNTCQQQLSVCQSTPPVNESLCTSNFEGCLSSSALAAAATQAPAAQPPCVQQYNTCNNTPPVDAGLCSSNFASCLFSSAGGTPGPTAGAPVYQSPYPSTTCTGGPNPNASAAVASCQAQHDTCVQTPPVNESFCEANLQGCLQTATAPVGCPATPAPFQSVPPNYPISAPPTITSCTGYPASTGSSYYPTNTAAAAASCQAQHDTCVQTPSVNESLCDANLQGCLQSATAPTQAPTVYGCPAPSYSINIASATQSINYFMGAAAKPAAGQGAVGGVMAAAGALVLALL